METQQFRTSITAAWDLDSGTLTHIRPYPWLHQTKEFQSEPSEGEMEFIKRDRGVVWGPGTDTREVPVSGLPEDCLHRASSELAFLWKARG